VGFCVVIENLRDHGQALLDSPFFRQFRTSAMGTTIAGSPEVEKLGELDAFLQRVLHVTAVQLRDDILGDALVLAYRPGSPAHPEQEQGLVLVRARNPKLLAGLIERINELQKDSGELEQLEARSYRGQTYYRRTDQKGTNYYFLRGPVLALAPQEAMLREALDRSQDAPSTGEPPLARRLRGLGVNRPLAALLINPRAFDPALSGQADAVQGAQAVALKTLLVYWKAMDDLALWLTLEEDVAIQVAVRAELTKLPPAASRFLTTAALPSELWRSAPPDAILTAAGRFDLSALAEVLSSFLAEEARKGLRDVVEGSVEAVLGRDALGDLAPQLGPDCGLWITAPPAEEKTWFPHACAVLRVRPGKGGAPADRILSNALNSLATLFVFLQNHGKPGPLRLKYVVQDRIEVGYLVDEKRFPEGLQPAFAFKEGYLVLATSPEAIGRFHVAPAKTAWALPGESPVLRLSVRALCRYLEARRGAITAYAARTKDLSVSQADDSLNKLLTVLRFVETVELTQQASPGRLIFRLRARLDKPLR
jgi:hypothetical protein